MKNLKAIANTTKDISYHTRIPLYYSIEDDAVYKEAGQGRYYVTDLISENTEADIKEAVDRWLHM